MVGGISIAEISQREGVSSATLKRWKEEYLNFSGSGQGTIKNLLEKKGYIVNKKRIARIMRENNLVCKRTNKFKVATTNSNHSLNKILF
jgi:transposase-like protein